MKRTYWILIVLVVALVASATVGWATTVYWRNNQYLLPAYYNARVMSAILTDHKLDLDAVTAANATLQSRVTALEGRMTTAEASIASNTAAITSHVANTTTAHNYDARFVRHFNAAGTQQMLAGWVYANGTLQTGGGGFTVSRTATGTYSLTPTTGFGDWPTAVITPMDVDPPCFVRWNSLSTTGNINFSLRDHVLLLDSDQEWCFVLTGP